MNESDENIAAYGVAEAEGRNVMRHQYRVLSELEKQQMQAIKATCAALFSMIDDIGNSRELSIAKTKCEEAVMWAVKHITK